jgi:CheY-like chemotaxis protein
VTADIPIVLLTAMASVKGQQDLATLPVVGVLGKPFDPMLLPATLASMLGWS